MSQQSGLVGLWCRKPFVHHELASAFHRKDLKEARGDAGCSSDFSALCKFHGAFPNIFTSKCFSFAFLFYGPSKTHEKRQPNCSHPPESPSAPPFTRDQTTSSGSTFHRRIKSPYCDYGTNQASACKPRASRRQKLWAWMMAPRWVFGVWRGMRKSSLFICGHLTKGRDLRARRRGADPDDILDFRVSFPGAAAGAEWGGDELPAAWGHSCCAQIGGGPWKPSFMCYAFLLLV